MYKKILILFLLVLTGCNNKSIIACNYKLESKQISLDINGINDDIESIKVRACFEIPNNILANEKYMDDLNNKLSNQYHYEDNILVKEYEINLDDKYSLALTLDDLRKKGYICE